MLNSQAIHTVLILRSRSRLTRILYDMKILRRRLELLEDRLTRSIENMRNKGAGDEILRSYMNAVKQVRYVVYALGILEVKLENILTLNAMLQDLVVVREILKELGKRVKNLPEVSAILDELGDGISDVMTEIPLNIDQQTLITRREAARKILDEAEKYVQNSGTEKLLS